MKEKIERLSKGIFEYEQPEIILSQDIIDVFIGEGETQTGSFVISNSADTPMKGLLYSSSNAVKLSAGSFNGVSSEIFYTVNCRYMGQGERVEGRIDIVSDCGEFCLPFTISVLGSTCKSSVGRINNFFSFQSLAQTNWNEALELFDSKAFYSSVIRGDGALACTYDALRSAPDRSMALEEFLLSRKKKPECTFFVGTSEINSDTEAISFMEKIVVTRNAWGYLRLKVETDCKYLISAKNVIENSDFVNGRFELRLIANLDGVPSGTVHGNIRIYSPLHEAVIPVTYRIKDGNEKRKERNLSYKKYILNLADLFIGYRCERLSRREYINDSLTLIGTLERLLDKTGSIGDDDEKKVATIREQMLLYRGYLAAIDERTPANESTVSSVLLKKREYETKNAVSYATALYIEALTVNNSSVRKANCDTIRSLFERRRNNPLLLFIYYDLDTNMQNDPALRYDCIKEMLDAGSNSTLLLSEAGHILSRDSELLSGAGRTECRILLYMIENNMINESILLDFVYSCRENDDCIGLQLKVLTRLHEVNNDQDLLTCICEKVIRADLRDRKYHVYFKEAVEARLSIVNIFEYYMFTYGSDPDEQIAQPVLLYFGYNSVLPDDLTACLYAYVVKHKDDNKAIYRAYFKDIGQFAVNSMINRKIDRTRAVIYADVLNRDLLDANLIECVPDILFTYGVDVKSREFRDVIVTNSLEVSEARYPIRNGHADVMLYTDSCTCWLEDMEGNRYLLRDSDKCVRYLHMQDMLAECYDAGSNNPRLLLYMGEKNLRYNESEDSYIALQKQISGIGTLKPEIMNVCYYNLAEYYYENYEGELLESYLAEIDIRMLDADRRNRMIELMIVRDMYDKVIEYVKEFGCENLSLKKLSKLCLHAAESAEDIGDKESIVAMSHYAFRNGTVDDRLLKFIADNFNGTTLEMYEIWNAAKQAGLDTIKLEENLLAQILFTENYLENAFSVFKSYYFKNNNRKLVRAFISYTAYKYFVCGRVTEDGFFEVLRSDPSLENSRIGILALLKFYSEKETLTQEEREFADTHIRQLLRKKVFYAFFKDFGDKLSLPESLLEKTYIEYRTDPRKMVYIHYSYGKDTEFKAEVMPDVGYGIFTKEFILFYGDVLQYFITESDGEGEEITESRAVACTSDPTDGRTTTKYDKINNILMAAELKDDKTVLQYLEQYCFTEYAIKRHFRPL